MNENTINVNWNPDTVDLYMSDGSVVSGPVTETNVIDTGLSFDDAVLTVNVSFIPQAKMKKRVPVVMNIRKDDVPTQLEEIIALRDSLGIPKHAKFYDGIGGISFHWEAYV